MDEHFDTEALRRLRLRRWPVLGLLGLNAAILVPILCDPHVWAVRVYHALPSALRIVRSGEPGEEIVHLLDWVCLPLYLLTLGILFLGRWRMCRDLVRDLELIPESRRLQFRVLWPPSFWIASAVLLLPQYLAFLWILERGCGWPFWPLVIPFHWALMLFLVHLGCAGKLPTRAFALLMALMVTSLMWDPLEAILWCDLLPAVLGGMLCGAVYLAEPWGGGERSKASSTSEGSNVSA